MPRNPSLVFLLCCTFAVIEHSWALTSKASVPIAEPKLMNQQELAGFRDKLAQQYSKKAEKAPSEPSAFYTGKPYLASTDTYAFKYRNYNPALARWTSEDPSGFPDGANNSYYAPTPTSEFDWMGLAASNIGVRDLPFVSHYYLGKGSHFDVSGLLKIDEIISNGGQALIDNAMTQAHDIEVTSMVLTKKISFQT